MEKLYGYVGKILRVDLSTRIITEESIDKYLPKYLGSKGLCARIYWDEVGPEVKPFDPGNELIFASGPATATGAMGGCKGTCAAKSPVWYPVTTFTHSSSAMFAPELKRAGYDALIIQGKADTPVYLWITSGKVEIRDGRDLWGKTTRNTRALLWEKHNKQTVVASIGPAGENLVVSAIISIGCNVTLGRGGLGAVMGSKKLKAIAIHGTGRVRVAQPLKLLEINKERASFCSIKVGEKRIVKGEEVVGVEWDETLAVNHGSVGADTQLRDLARLGKVKIKPNACESCALFCRTKYNFIDGSQLPTSMQCGSNIGWSVPEAIANKWNKKMLGLVSYEFTTLCDDIGLNMHDFCILAPLYGQMGPFDEKENIEGSLLGGDWLYQAYLFGILNEANTGLPWDKFGTSEFTRRFIQMVAYREGFGDILAKGFRYATRYIMEHEEFGPDREKILFIYRRINAKAGNMGCLESGHGQYVPNPCRAIYTAVGDRTGSEPEFLWTSTTKRPSSVPQETREKWLGSGTNKILDLYYWGPEVAKAVIKFEHQTSCMESLHRCRTGTLADGALSYSRISNRPIAETRDLEDWINHSPTGGSEYLSAIFGRDVTYEELDKTGEMIVNLVRAIWIRDGYTTVDDPFWGKAVDTLWDMHFERKGSDGKSLTLRTGFEATIKDYYKERGWVKGVPSRATLERLGLKDVADDLASRNLLPV
ncbi:aldehyde ferredoxin oxidoreductase N-terminal domain-containing protein [Chloroflexota bacterium]